jgi:hypothetical protein
MRTLLVTCVDAGIRGEVEELEERLGIVGCDRLQVPGGPLALVAEGSPRQAVLAWVELLARFKDVGAVHLLSHQHCLAYKRNLGGFFHDEREVLERDLLAARRTLEGAVYGLRVECHLLPWVGGEAGGYMAAEPVGNRAV